MKLLQPKNKSMTSSNSSVKQEIEFLKQSNDVQHEALSLRISDLKEGIKDNREFFTKAIDSLDKKVWTLVILTLSTLLTTVISMVL